MLQATGLSKSYGSVPVVQEVTFSLQPGQIIGYLGPNGSGKSTTVKMLTGLLQPTNGQVTYNGEDVHKNLVAYRKHLGYVPEEASLYPYLTGKEYLEMVATLRSMPEPRQKSRINQLLELWSRWQHRDIPLGSYSKGMRQRILLIASLLDNPEVLVLDEPLSGLDVTSALIVKSLVQALSTKGKAIFFCSHVLEVVERICSWLIILRKGQVIAYGETSQVVASIGQSSLENTFLHLVEERDVTKVANEIVDVVIA
jgi:ABC-2 type transport system ATP-binding protein